MKQKVAIIGNGWVGGSMHKLFPDAFIYSRGFALNSDNIMVSGYPKDSWEKTYKEEYKTQVNEADIAFICVPTPNFFTTSVDPSAEEIAREGKLDTSGVEEVIAWCEATIIVVRSTVNPGDCDTWMHKYGKRIVFQPEYLGETPRHPLLNEKKTPFVILGGNPYDTRQIIELYTTVYNAKTKIRQVTLYEAEVIKLTENRAIAFKVAQCQELYDVCEKSGTDYYTIRDAVYGDDPRFNLWWTLVFPDARGFNSKCIPKDVYAWAAWAESMGYEPKITRSLLEKNKEWIA